VAVQKLHGILQRISSDKQNQAQLIDQGLEPWTGTPAQFERFIEDEIARWKQVVSRAGIPQLN
jgi:tripartite-type tricarboxylate transporter receptor subunit TctC